MSMASEFKKIQFYFRPDIPRAKQWENKLKRLIRKSCPQISVLEANDLPRTKKRAPQLLIVLGGDGAILEAAQKFQRWSPKILGFNLGHVGFLASVRMPKHFLPSLQKVLNGNYRIVPRMLIQAKVIRHKKTIFSGYALNDISIQNLLGLVDLKIEVEGHPVQYIHGTGVIVATATGSTAYNLSAHGPIVMPDIKCLIITEVLDHNIPTPSLIIKRNRVIEVVVNGFRKNDRFIIRKTGEAADVILAADAERIVALRKGDRIIIKKSERLMRFIELEKNYFFKSLQEKFAFK